MIVGDNDNEATQEGSEDISSQATKEEAVAVVEAKPKAKSKVKAKTKAQMKADFEAEIKSKDHQNQVLKENLAQANEDIRKFSVEMADLHVQLSVLNNKIRNQENEIISINNEIKALQPLLLTSGVIFDGVSSHFEIISSEGIQPIATIKTLEKIDFPRNLTAIDTKKAMANFGINSDQSEDIMMICEDSSNVYLFGWSQIKSLGLSWDRSNLESDFTIGYSDGS